MPSGPREVGIELVRRDAGACVLAVSGELSERSAGLVTRAVSKALLDVGRVLVNVSGLRLAWPPALRMFTSILEDVGGWPGARLVVFGADDPGLAEALTAPSMSTTVPVAPNEASAWRLLDRRPPTIARHLDLEQAPVSARRARRFVEVACMEWRLDAIRDNAVIVASELVANAVVHAGTACRLTLRYETLGLTIAVRDYRPDRAPLVTLVDSPSQRGHGLSVIAALSLDFGIIPTPDGKTMWAFLTVTSPATYSRVVRRATHAAVRTVLQHGTTSPNAASAVRRLAIHLAQQHGVGAVQALATELALHLDDATSVVASMSQRDAHNGTNTAAPDHLDLPNGGGPGAP